MRACVRVEVLLGGVVHETHKGVALDLGPVAGIGERWCFGLRGVEADFLLSVCVRARPCRFAWEFHSRKRVRVWFLVSG